MGSSSILANMLVYIGARKTDFDKALTSSSNQLKQFNSLAIDVDKTLTAFGVGFGIYQVANGIKAAVSTIADFEKNMSEVKAITGATGDEFKALEADALRLGSATKFTASEVAKLQIAYGRLGFNNKEILAATEATLDLAAATGEDLAKSADVAGSTVRGFNLRASETQRVVDVMAASFNQTALGLDNFTESMKYVAPIAAAANVSVEETTALLGVLADNGIRGSQAGTSLRKIFTDLSKDGRPLRDRLAELAAKGLNLSGAMDEVGRTAQTSLLVLAKNTERTNELTQSFHNVTGAASAMAREMQDNLIGDVEKLSSAWDGLILKMKNTSWMRGVVQEFTKLFNSISGDQDVGLTLEDLAKSIKSTSDAANDVSETKIKVFVDQLKQLRQEAGKPIDTNIASELAAKYQLTDDQANRLYETILNINKSIGDQEKALRQFKDFQFGREFSNQLEQLKIDRRSAFTTDEIKEFDQKISETTKNLEDHRRKFEDTSKAIAVYKQRLYELIAAEHIQQDSTRNVNTEGQYDADIEASQRRIKEYRFAIGVLNEYAESQKDVTSSIVSGTTAIEADAAAKRRNIDMTRQMISGIKEYQKAVTDSIVNAQSQDGLGKMVTDFNKNFKTLPTSLPMTENMMAQLEALKQKNTEVTETLAGQWIDLGPLIANSISTIAEGIGQAAVGVGNFGTSLIKAVAGFGKQLGEILVASGLAMIAAKAMITNPYTAIAAGVALIAISAAAMAGMSRAQTNFNAGGGGSATRNSNSAVSGALGSRGMEITVGGEFRIQGNDLVYILNRQGQLNSRTR